MCFGNGHEVAVSWLTFCGSMIARNIESIWDSIRRARQDHTGNIIGNNDPPTSDFSGSNTQERVYEMFSLEHLKYCFGRQYIDWHGDTPIVWYTASSCLRKEIGSACICTISPYRIPAAQSTEETSRSTMLHNILGATKDNFWQCVNKPGMEYNFSVMILCRILCLFVVTTYNEGVSRKASQQNIYNLMLEVSVGDGNSLDLIYGNKLVAENYIKNHLTSKVKGSLLYFSMSSSSNFYKTKVTDKFRCALVAGLKGRSVEDIKELYDNNTGRNIPSHLKESFDIFDTHGAGLVALNHMLEPQGFSNLGGAMKHACRFGLLTQGLLSRILSFRVEYDRNRHIYNESLSTMDAATINYNSNANTRLFATADFDVSPHFTTIS
jgi:hypothetical protein